MANNRTEAKTAVSTALVPTLTLAQHITLLNDEINESTVFRKDVIASETPVGGNVTIDYSDKDTATVTTAVNLAVSFTNIVNGDVKYLEIIKAATNTISFAGSTDVSPRKNYINTAVTVVAYEVKNKNGNIYVNSINVDNNSTFPPYSIGSYDMTSGSLAIPLAAIGVIASAIRGINVLIIDDSGNLHSFYGTNALGLNGGDVSVIGANLILSRTTGGRFDVSAFSNLGVNRGYVNIDLIT